MVKELCFKLKPIKENLNEDYIIDSFISFAIDNNISISGSLSIDFCFCSYKEFPELKIKSKFLKYLRISHSGEFKKITYKKYNYLKDGFEDLNEVII